MRAGLSVVIVMLGILVQGAEAGTIYVKADARGAENGRTWRDAHADLQAALARAEEGDQIWVAAGVYRPTATADRDIAFDIPNGVQIYGGFGGVEASLDQRDWTRRITIMSGDIGAPGSPGDNSYHIVTSIGSIASTRLDGFTLTGAYNDRVEVLGRGGAMYNENSLITVANCRFEYNVGGAGGAAWNQGGAPRYEHCYIYKNRSRAFSNSASEPVYLNCVFEQNSSWHTGGAVSDNSGSASRFENCRFLRNDAGREGGAYFAQSGDQALLDFKNCEFIDNVTDDSFGGAVYIWSGRGRVVGCTFVGNRSARSSAGLLGHADVANCIFWGNRGENAHGEDAQLSLGNGSIDYSCVEGWTGKLGGEGNIGDNPLLAFDSDAHLTAGSAVIDAGTPDPPGGLPERDLDGNHRSIDGDEEPGAAPDMGAYEFNPSAASIAVSRERVEFLAAVGGDDPVTQSVRLRNAGGGSLKWQVDKKCDWLDVKPSSGLCHEEVDQVVLSPRSQGLAHGKRTCRLVITDGASANQERVIPVTIQLSTLLRVPDEFPTIQAAVDAAVDGDTVVVADGIYKGPGNRDISFHTKAITVRSQDGPYGCVIDCQGSPQKPRRGFFFDFGAPGPAVLNGFTIRGGYAQLWGGGIHSRYSDPLIMNCIISGNSSGRSGGGIQCDDRRVGLTLVNTLITNNRTVQEGGGFAFRNSTPTIINCTFFGNEAGGEGGAICDQGIGAIVINSILWGDTPTETCGGSEISYSTVQNWPRGEHVISADPLFANPTRGDFSLLPGSPCIDAADNEAVLPDYADLDGDGDREEPMPLDFDGYARFIDDPETSDTGNGQAPIVDMGAFEFQVADACTEQAVIEFVACNSRHGVLRNIKIDVRGVRSHSPIEARFDSGEVIRTRSGGNERATLKLRGPELPPCGPNGVSVCGLYREFDCGC